VPQWASTLLAVFVGGLLTYLAQRLLEDRRADRERKREADLSATELRVAMRLLLEDLDAIALHYKMLADEGRYPDARDEADARLYFPTEGWHANKRTLAAALSDDEWVALSSTMHAAERSRVVVLRGAPLEPIQPPIRHELQNGGQLAHDLYLTLAGTPPPSVE
jgi:hypothetical protein